MLTRSAALELLPAKARVNAIVPGPAKALRLVASGGRAVAPDPASPGEVARLAAALAGASTSGLCYPVPERELAGVDGRTGLGPGLLRGRV